MADVDWDGEQILDLPTWGNNYLEQPTVRAYLQALLAALWSEGENFSGKRPLGDSDWEYDLYDALGRAGAIPMTFDTYGVADELSDGARLRGDRLIFLAIAAL